MPKNSSIKIVEESNIKIKLSKKDKKKKKQELQRTKEWREDRRGEWTGSQLKNLMSCSPGKGNLSWDNLDRILSFGKTALKYIYSNAKERQTGRYIDDGEGTYQMRYGTRVEPLIFKATKEILKEKGLKGKLKEVGYKRFEDIPNTGVSADAILINSKKETIAAVEMKACTNWETHYERTFDLMDEKSKDFWQIQGETKAHKVNICYYAVAEPPHDIKKYLFHEGNIMDLYDEWRKECLVTLETVKASEIHQTALLKRIMIAEDALADFISVDDCRLDKALDETIELYAKEPERFEKYIPILKENLKKEITKKVFKSFSKKDKIPNQDSFTEEKKKVKKKMKQKKKK